MLNKFSWLQNEENKKIIKVLTINKTPTFQFVGGCIRDSLLNKKTQDFDIASTLTPIKNIYLLKNNNIKFRCNAVKYGTITAMINKSTFEITTLRKDVLTFGREAVISNVDNYKEDAKRRDFTINALYLNPVTLKITDYFDGIKDLMKGKIRFIGDIETRITEDYLRILRFIRFYTYFGKTSVSTVEINTIKKYINKLTILSKERIAFELNKIINHKNYVKGIKLLNKLDIPCVLFNQKKFNISKLIYFNNFIQENHIIIPNIMKWYVLLDNPNNNIKFLKNNKKDTYYINLHKKISLSLNICKKFSYLLARYDINYLKSSIILLLLKCNKRSIIYSYLSELLTTIQQKNNFKFCITGKDLIKLGIPQNKNFGKIMLQLKEWGIENNIKCKKLYIEKAKALSLNLDKYD